MEEEEPPLKTVAGIPTTGILLEGLDDWARRQAAIGTARPQQTSDIDSPTPRVSTLLYYYKDSIPLGLGFGVSRNSPNTRARRGHKPTVYAGPLYCIGLKLS